MRHESDDILRVIEQCRQYLSFLNDPASLDALQDFLAELEARAAHNEQRERVIAEMLDAGVKADSR